MKKLFVMFLFLMSFTSFAWETIEIVDEFREPTGQIRIVKDDTDRTSYLFVDKTSSGYNIGFYCQEFIGGKGVHDTSVIKIKIDTEKPVVLDGYVWSNDHTVSATLPEELLSKMKKGNTMKAVIQKYDDQTVLLKFYLDDFEEQLKKVK